jgi:uncharacterized protein YecT (DUF1311 family)
MMNLTSKIGMAVLLVIAFLALASLSSRADTPNKMTPVDIGKEMVSDIQDGVTERRKGDEQDPVRSDLVRCLAEPDGLSTTGTNDCLVKAYTAYDKVLNGVYQKALKKNDEETKKSLRISQKKWLAFREAEDVGHKKYVTANGGSMWGTIILYNELTAIKERISELMFYLNNGND